MISLVPILLILTFSVFCPVKSADTLTALRFGTTSSDYIRFNFDMSPFRSSLTVCTWVKRVFTGSSGPIIFNNYVNGNHEILMSAIGSYNRVVRDDVVDNSNQYFTTPANNWFHYCLNWARSTNMIQLFVNGQLVRTGQTSSSASYWRDFRSSGDLWFNRLGHSYSGATYTFGGELYQFNIFSVVLSPESIKKIAKGGLCFPLDEFSDSRVLKWEDILTKSRTGSVTEVRVTECDWKKEFQTMQEKLQGELNKTRKNLESVMGRLNTTLRDLETKNDRLNRTEHKLEASTGLLNRTELALTTANRKLNQTELELDTAKRNLSTIVEELATAKRNLSTTVEELTTTKSNLSRTQEDLGTCSTTLTDTKEELAESRRLSNITKWDVLYTSPYHNRILTEELIERLKSNWDVLS